MFASEEDGDAEEEVTAWELAEGVALFIDKSVSEDVKVDIEKEDEQESEEDADDDDDDDKVDVEGIDREKGDTLRSSHSQSLDTEEDIAEEEE